MVQELVSFIGLAEKMGDEETALKCRKQFGELRQEPELTMQERAQQCNDRLQELEETLVTEVEKLELSQDWVATQAGGVRKVEAALLDADAEYATIDSELAGSVARPEPAEAGQTAQKVSLAEVVDGKCGVTGLIDFVSSFKVGDELELTSDDIRKMESSKEQLRAQMQAATKGLFQSAMEKVESIKAEHSEHAQRLRRKRVRVDEPDKQGDSPGAGDEDAAVWKRTVFRRSYTR